MAHKERIDLDGRTLEGGGQLVRLATCLSALTGTPIHITNIRGNRPKDGGLKAQHVACVTWLARACSATTEGLSKGSKTLTFTPGLVYGLSPVFQKQAVPSNNNRPAYTTRIDIGTVGSTTLALQAILPFILFTTYPENLPIHLTLTGGTNVTFSPSVDYINHVLIPNLASIGIPLLPPLLQTRGWMTTTNQTGNWLLKIPPRPQITLPAFTLLPTNTHRPPPPPRSIHALFLGPAHTHPLFRSLVQPALTTAFQNPPNKDPSALKITCEATPSERQMYILLTATIPLTHTPSTPATFPETYTLGADYLLPVPSRKNPATPEVLITHGLTHAANALFDEYRSGAVVDVHMRDQIVVFAALAKGRSKVFPGWKDVSDDGGTGEGRGVEREGSLHARTAEWVAREVLGEGVEVGVGVGGGCEGVGFSGREDLIE